jgi:hypothetical protein
MNKIELERARMENFKKLDIAYRPKINTVEVNVNNTIEHELAKFYCVWLIRKGIPAYELQTWFDTSYLEFNKRYKTTGNFKHEWERPQCITEARMKDGARWDIFVLDSGECIEIETGKSYVKNRNGIVIKI